MFVTTKLYAMLWPAAVTVVGDADFTTLNAGAGVAVTVAADGGDVTAGPVGGVPDAVAEFFTDPAFISACVTTYDAVHVVDAAGANVVTGHDTVGFGPAGAVIVSATVTPVRVTFPVFVTTKLYAMLWPAAVTVVGDADFTTLNAGAGVIGTTTVLDVADVGPPIASVARTDAEFVIDPAFASACVATYVAVHVVDAPTASAVAGHATVGVGPAGGVTTSVTAIFDSGTSPVFVTTNE